MPGINRSPRARALAAALRDERKAKGLTVREIARRLQVNHSVLSRAESGARIPKENEVATILGAIGVAPDDRERIVEMARDVDRETWSEVSHRGAPTQLDTLMKYERDATSITDVNPLLISGLCQTMAYARAIMSADPSKVHPSEVEGRVMYRMGRQRAAEERPGPHVTVVIDEPVLLRRIGGRQVMADQLDHLVKLSEQPHMSIRVTSIEAGYHSALAGGWLLLEFNEAPPVVHLEHVDSGTFLHRAPSTREFLKARDSLLSVAMSTEESARLIATHADHHRRGDELYERT